MFCQRHCCDHLFSIGRTDLLENQDTWWQCVRSCTGVDRRDSRITVNLMGDFRKPQYLRMLLEQCAASSSRMVNVSSLSAAMEVNRPTVLQYLFALQTMFLAEKLPAWQNKIIKRVATTPKLMLCDSGLMAYLTNLGSVDLALGVEDKARTDLVGNLIKTWVFQQLVPIADLGRKWKLCHFRNTSGKELDFILESRDGELICLELNNSPLKREGFLRPSTDFSTRSDPA